jgi:pentatricopeptide repeat protein
MGKHNVVSWCSLLYAYVASGLMIEAHKLFDEMPTRINIAWNSLLMGYSRTGNANQLFFRADLLQRSAFLLMLTQNYLTRL